MPEKSRIDHRSLEKFLKEKRKIKKENQFGSQSYANEEILHIEKEVETLVIL